MGWAHEGFSLNGGNVMRRRGGYRGSLFAQPHEGLGFLRAERMSRSLAAAEGWVL